jgi:acid phosphatase class B
MKTPAAYVTLLATLATVACSQPVDTDADANDDVAQAEGELSQNGGAYAMSCKKDGSTVRLVLTKQQSGIAVSATAGGEILFEAGAQRGSLGARIEDGATSVVHEIVGFDDQGLETVPVDGPRAIEIDLDGSKAVTYKDANKTVQLTCRFSNDRLVDFAGIDLVSQIDMTGVKAVGFDIDDTLAFTTPTFARAFATGGQPKPDDVLFWRHTNGCDQGCDAQSITLLDGSTKLLPANAASNAKSKAVALIAKHKSLGHRVYAITARPDINGEPLRDYLEQELGIDRDDVFFEPDIDLPGNPKGKTDRIESLDLDLFYGDADSDITDAAKAFVDGAGVRHKTVRAVRFQRSPKSSNRKAGKLNKYHPGYYGEPVLRGSYE